MPGTFSGTPGNDIQISGYTNLYGNNGNDELAQGESPNGVIQGNNGNDILYFIQLGASGTIQGGEGNDAIDGNNLGDHLYGDQGDDRISGLGGKDDLHGGDGRDLLDGGSDNDLIFGGRGDDSNTQQIQFPYFIPTSGPASMSKAPAGLFGGTGNDYIDGGEGNDYVDGGNGVDVLVGGLGADALNGGNDGDIFRYFSFKESKRGASKADHILDFELGFDQFDLRKMDANSKKDGIQKFKFIGKKGFHDKPAELRYKAGKAEADVNGDGKADWQVFVDDSPKLGRNDFDI